MRRGRAHIGGGRRGRDSEQPAVCSTQCCAKGGAGEECNGNFGICFPFAPVISQHFLLPASGRAKKKPTQHPMNIFSAPSDGDLSTSAVLWSVKGDLDASLGGADGVGLVPAARGQQLAGSGISHPSHERGTLLEKGSEDASLVDHTHSSGSAVQPTAADRAVGGQVSAQPALRPVLDGKIWESHQLMANVAPLGKKQNKTKQAFAVSRKIF